MTDTTVAPVEAEVNQDTVPLETAEIKHLRGWLVDAEAHLKDQQNQLADMSEDNEFYTGVVETVGFWQQQVDRITALLEQQAEREAGQ